MLHTNSEALAELSKHFNVELQFNSNDVADFFVQGHQVLFYGHPHQSKLVLVAEIDTGLDFNDPKILRELLQANYLGNGTGLASFGLDPETGDLVINQTLEVRYLTSESLIEEVTKYLKYVIFWNTKIGSLFQSEGGSVSATNKDDELNFVKV